MNIAIYCGSSFGKGDEYKIHAQNVVKYLKQKNDSIVYGGSESGIMGVVSNEAIALDMNVTGVITNRLATLEKENTKLKDIIKVETIRERKQVMLEKSDAFLVLPGGLGTFDEIFEVLTLIQIGEINKPCAFLNVHGYYDKLKEFLYSCVDQGFIQKRFIDMITFDSDIAKIHENFTNYKEIRAKWDK